MAYCVNTDVKSQFKALTYASSGTGLTSAEVDAWISEADAYIDSRIGIKYAVPITETADLKILKTISTYLVAERVQARLEVLTGSEMSNQNQKPRMSFDKLAKMMIQEIVDGKLKFDTDLLSSGDGAKGTIDDEDISPYFERETEQW